MERIRTGNDTIDLILDGGFPTQSIHVLMGVPGSGKTILAEQLVFANADEDRPALYLTTLSEPLAKFITYLQEYTFADSARIGTAIVYEEIAEELSRSPETLADLVSRRIRKYRPRIIVIDSFKAIADLMPDAASWRRTLHDLAGVLSAYDATSFWVGEYTTAMISELPEFAVADGIVELTREQQGMRDKRLLRVVKLRGSGFRDGAHPFRITADGLQVFPRLITPPLPPDYSPSAERLESGISGLDEMIETGWLRGTSTLVVGPSGAGKTVLGLHFLRAGVQHGESGLLMHFQENPSQLTRIMRHFGWETKKLLGPGMLDVYYNSPVELQIDTIVTELFRRIEAHGVRRVVVDALGDLEASARDRRRFQEYLYAMTQHFAARNVTAMLALETSGLFSDGGATGSHELSHLSDNILLLEMRLDDDLQRSIRVVKSRGSAHDGRRHPLRITAQGIVVD